MNIQEMVYQFKLTAQRVDTQSAPGLKLAQIIIYLNKGIRNLLMQRYGSNNAYAATLESIQKRLDEWQRLIVPHEKITMAASADDDVFEADLTKTTKPYLFLLRCSFLGSKGDCKEQKLRSKYSPSDDLDVNLDNPNSKPNFDWRETLHRLAEDKLLAYSDGTFDIDAANIDYLRYPKDVDISGYTHFDGSSSSDVDCELPVFLHDDIVQEAVVAFQFGEQHPGAKTAVGAKALLE